MTLSSEQKKAIELAVNPTHKVVAIYGGAGVGKTTIIREIVERLNGNIHLASFTAKAANRISESTGARASTIHRLLGWMGIGFTVKKINMPVLIDEASMVSSFLMASIIKAKPPYIVLIGDDAQLSPVGTGAPFRDFLKFYPNKCLHLTKSFRSSAAIFKATSAIRNGQQPLNSDSSSGETFKVIQCKNTDMTVATLKSWMNRDGFWDPEQDILLAAVNDKPGGVKELNKMMVEVFNPREGDEKFLVGDRVINLKNNSDIEVWNGDTGTITGIDQSGGFYVCLDREYEGEVHFTKAMQKDLSLAYCLSVHKSQGSEYRKVIFICLKHHVHSLNRSLIYTALTRAKQASAVMGNSYVFHNGINKVSEKNTIINIMKEGSLINE